METADEERGMQQEINPLTL